MKVRMLLVLFCAWGGAGAEEGEPGADLPEKARLSPGRRKYRMRRNYPLPPGVAEAESPGMRKGKVEKLDVWFFDVDGNGTYGDAGTDGWALTDMPYMLPYEEKTIIGVSNLTWRIEPDGSAVRYRKEPLPLAEGQRRILIAFNQWRLMNGLPAVRINPELTDACMKHCDYMDRNGMEHAQDPDKPGYTPEGDQAGRRSCLSEEPPDRSVTMFYASFYHRLPVFLPGTRSIGVGHSGRYTAIDALSDKEDRPWTYPIVIPAPNTFMVPTLFARESPNPGIPEGMTAGFPITLTFDGRAKITDAKAELRFRSRNGYLPVPVLVSSPEAPANKDRPDNRNSICVIPRQPLRPRTTYQVEVRWKEDGADRREEWLFNTGLAGPNPRLR